MSCDYWQYFVCVRNGEVMLTTQELRNLFNRFRDVLNTPLASRFDNNFDFYQQLYDVFTKEGNTSIKEMKVNLSFISEYGKLVDFRSNDYLDLIFQMKHIDIADFDDFVLGEKTLAELVKSYSEKFYCEVNFSDKIFKSSYSSWDNYLSHIRYDEANLIVPSETPKLEKCLNDNSVVWCHNKSCSGKTLVSFDC